MQESEVSLFEQKSPVKKISILHRLNANGMSKPLAEIGLVRGTLPFLMEVLCRDGLVQQDITEALSIDPAATARALQQLEKQGFVKRREDAENRRQKRVSVTDKTVDMQEKLLGMLQRQRNKLFQGFTEKEQKDFIQMLDRMIQNMQG